MDINVTERGDVTFVSLSGKMDFSASKIFMGVVEKIDPQKTKEVIFDLEKLKYIDSMGLSLLVRAHDRGYKNGFETSISKATGVVETVLQAANFEGLFKFK